MYRDLTTGRAWWARLTQDGSSASDVAYAVATTADGSVIFSGSTFGLWAETHAGSSDFIASKLDSEGTLMWTWQVKRLHCLQSCIHKSWILPLLAAAGRPWSTPVRDSNGL